MIEKVHIATSRPIGDKCIKYAKAHMPDGYEFCENIQDSDVLLCVMYDTILKEDFISQRRCYNFHGGVLPEYRGVGIFSWAIINEEEETGITLHELDKGLDTGPVIACQKFPINKDSTAHSLFEKGMDVVYEMFVEHFCNLVTGQYIAKSVSKKPNSLYTRKMLDEKRDITNLLRALTFPGKEGMYYYTSEGDKIFLNEDYNIL
tara:strand:- start:1035 stop:1646 length:612 start_codon:yes stop_codon:yes gene_type:complete